MRKSCRYTDFRYEKKSTFYKLLKYAHALGKEDFENSISEGMKCSTKQLLIRKKLSIFQKYGHILKIPFDHIISDR